MYEERIDWIIVWVGRDWCWSLVEEGKISGIGLCENPSVGGTLVCYSSACRAGLPGTCHCVCDAALLRGSYGTLVENHWARALANNFLHYTILTHLQNKSILES